MIKVSGPLLRGNEKKYVCEALDDGEVSSEGKFVRRFEEAFAKWSGNDYAVAVSSGTAALETAIWSLDFDKFESICVPCGTIISCYIAAERAGYKVKLVDNFESVYKFLMRCHLFGNLNKSQGMVIVDDLSQYWKPFTVQDVGAYSLYANKLITSGEGGVVVTNREDIYCRALAYRNLCHGAERFIHKDKGYNFRMSNLQAAVALAQLEQIDDFTKIKQKNRDLYLKYLPTEVGCLFKVEVPWMYLIRTNNDAGVMVERMGEHDIECRRFFYPLHRQPCLPKRMHSFKAADDLWNHTFYLPSGLTLTEGEIVRVCEVLQSVL